MSISVYYGRAGSGKTRAVYERIRQVMTDCPGEPIILLVPEPATYRVERELAEFMLEKGFTTVEEAEKALAERKPEDKLISIGDTKELEKKEDVKLTSNSKELIIAKKHNAYLRQEQVTANNAFYGLAGFGAAKPVAEHKSFTEAKPVEVSGSILRKNDKRVAGMTGANWFNNLMLNKTKKD